MAIEIEKKFLLKFFPDLDNSNSSIEKIQQGYLFFSISRNNVPRHCRIRIINNKNSFITFKIGKGQKREEIEYEIPLKDGLYLYNECNYKLEKKRYHYKDPNLNKNLKVIIDFFPVINETVVEIESDNIDDFNNFTKPYYCGKEVSDDPRFSNIVLAKTNTIRFNK